MSLSAHLPSEQLKEINEEENVMNKGGRELQGQVEDGEEVLDPEHSSSVYNSVLNTINNEYEQECLDEMVRLQNAHPICQSKVDWAPGNKYPIAGLPGTNFLLQQVMEQWLIVRRWTSTLDMPGLLVADEMGLGKTLTSVAVAM